MALTKDKMLTLVIVGVVPLMSAAIVLIALRAFPMFQSIQKKIDKINLVLREGLTGIRVIRAFNREYHEKERFDLANLGLTETSIQVNRLMAFMFPIMMFFMNVTTLAVIWFGAMRINIGKTNIGNMLAFLQYAMQIMFSIIMATFLFILLPRAEASAERLNEVLGDFFRYNRPDLSKKIRKKEGVCRVQKRLVQVLRSGTACDKEHNFFSRSRGGDGHYWRHRLRKIDPCQSYTPFLRCGKRKHRNRRD